MVIGSVARWAIPPFTESLSGKRSMARCRLSSLILAPGFSSSAHTVVSPPCATRAAASGSDNSDRPAMAVRLAVDPRRTMSARSSSVSTRESPRIGRATASTSLAIDSATSRGNRGECRRLLASAPRTVTSTSLAMMRTISCAVRTSVSVSNGLSRSRPRFSAISTRVGAEGSASRRSMSDRERAVPMNASGCRRDASVSPEYERPVYRAGRDAFTAGAPPPDGAPSPPATGRCGTASRSEDPRRAADARDCQAADTTWTRDAAA